MWGSAETKYKGEGFQKSQKFITFVNRREGGRPFVILKPFRIIPVLSKHVFHLVWVAHIEIKKDKQTYLSNISRIANALQVTL